MKEYTIKAGKHDFKPREWPSLMCTNILSLRWEFMFTESCRYNLHSVDQLDWNKGGGVSFHLFRNHIDSCMWAWRYSLEKELIEITAYSNMKDAPNGRWIGWGKDQVLMYLPMKTIGVCTIRHIRNGEYEIRFRRKDRQDDRYPQQALHQHRKDWKWAKRTGLWFGGNQRAPQNMSIFVSYEAL